MLKLKLQSFGHLMQRADTFEKTLMLGKIEGGRRGSEEAVPGHWVFPSRSPALPLPVCATLGPQFPHLHLSGGNRSRPRGCCEAPSAWLTASAWLHGRCCRHWLQPPWDTPRLPPCAAESGLEQTAAPSLPFLLGLQQLSSGHLARRPGRPQAHLRPERRQFR